jgi:hypothetical protein
MLPALVLAVVDGECRSRPRSLRGRTGCGGRRGPAGLAAAWAIRRVGLDPLIAEKADKVAGAP